MTPESCPLSCPQDLSILQPFKDGRGPELKGLIEDMDALDSAAAVVSYDKDCFMPSRAADDRPAIMEVLEKLAHRLSTAPSYASLVDELYENRALLANHDRRNIELLKKDLDHDRKLPEEFVAEKANVIAASGLAWEMAKEKSDFAMMIPFLERLITLHRREAELVGYTGHPYDVHLDCYEPGTTLADIETVLTRLADKLAPLIQEIAGRQDMACHGPLVQCSDEQQILVQTRIARDLGYDFERGRIDRFPHPFCQLLSTNDVRIATRPEPDMLLGLYTIVHETGHALYALGLPGNFSGTPVGNSASYGIDESQSRILENNIGRSFAFCRYLERVLQEELDCSVPAQAIWQQVNRVSYGLIRVNADEVSYNLHIVIRTQLEVDLLSGKLSVQELPDAWAAKYKQYLGSEPKNHREGVLQDMHWYFGDMGYFPTYALGNIFAASFHDKIKQDIPQLDEDIAAGNFKPLRDWLHSRIHRHGNMYPSLVLARSVTGEAFSEEALLKYFRSKFLSENGSSAGHFAGCRNITPFSGAPLPALNHNAS